MHLYIIAACLFYPTCPPCTENGKHFTIANPVFHALLSALVSDVYRRVLLNTETHILPEQKDCCSFLSRMQMMFATVGIFKAVAFLLTFDYVLIYLFCQSRGGYSLQRFYFTLPFCKKKVCSSSSIFHIVENMESSPPGPCVLELSKH